MFSTKNVLPERGFSLRTPDVQLSRYRVGEPSLSSELECLSLRRTILSQEAKSGNEHISYGVAHENWPCITV